MSESPVENFHQLDSHNQSGKLAVDFADLLDLHSENPTLKNEVVKPIDLQEPILSQSISSSLQQDSNPVQMEEDLKLTKSLELNFPGLDIIFNQLPNMKSEKNDDALVNLANNIAEATADPVQ